MGANGLTARIAEKRLRLKVGDSVDRPDLTEAFVKHGGVMRPAKGRLKTYTRRLREEVARIYGIVKFYRKGRKWHWRVIGSVKVEKNS